MSSEYKEDVTSATGNSGEQRHDISKAPFFAGEHTSDMGEDRSRADLAPLYFRLEDIGGWSDLDRTLRIGPSGRSGEFTTADPSKFINRLLSLGRFCVDTRAGKVLHPGAYAFRELSNRESLHVAVHGTRVRAHLDRVSPLVGSNPNKGQCRYSFAQVLAHVTGRLGARLVRELKGGWIKLDVACSRMRMRGTP